MADLTREPTSLSPQSTPAPPPENPATAETYRPLSLLALGGFILAILCACSVLLGGIEAFATRYPRLLGLLFAAAVAAGWLISLGRKRRSAAEVTAAIAVTLLVVATGVGLGSLVAFSSTTPWLLPAAFWFVLVAAAGVCWLALARISASEGTLGGASLARWGLGLSLFFGLNYGAYLASTSFAVKTQARECADEFLALLKKGDLDRAFLMTMPVRSRPGAGTDIHSFIESINRATSPAGGPYTSFTRQKMVQLVRIVGEDATYEPAGVAIEYKQGGYEVNNVYRVTAPIGTFEIVVTTFGKEEGAANASSGSSDAAAANTAVRRQWKVELNQTGIKDNLIPTQEGQKMVATVGTAFNLAREWTELLTAKRFEQAYLLTLPAKEREGQASASFLRQSALLGATGVALPGALKRSSSELGPLKKGLQAFESGSILDLKELYPPAGAARERIVSEIKPFFCGKIQPGTRMEMAMIDIPWYQISGDTVTVRLPVQIKSQETGKLRLLEADVEVVGPWTSEHQPAHAFRVKSLIPLRGQDAPDDIPGGNRR